MEILKRLLKFGTKLLAVTALALGILIIGPFVYVGTIIFYAVQIVWAKIDWQTCKYCNEKKEMFFYTHETHIRDSGDYIEGTEQICTTCAIPYFDNGGKKESNDDTTTK